jgi:hypothetical protein
MTSSTIPAARTNLVAGLAALQATTLAGVTVSRTGAWDEMGNFDSIAVLNARDINRAWPMFGFPTFDETYTIPVDVRCFNTGNDVSVVETRMWALITIVESYVLANTTLGVTAIQTALPEGLLPPGEESGPIENDTLHARGTVSVRVRALVS